MKGTKISSANVVKHLPYDLNPIASASVNVEAALKSLRN